MHYLNPKVAGVLYGPIKDPLASGYVVTDEDGGIYISPKLAEKAILVSPKGKIIKPNIP